jgi:hypothetical protein
MSDSWFIQRDGRADGPFPAGRVLELFDLSETGSDQFLVRSAGDAEWVPLHTQPWFRQRMNARMDGHLRGLGLCLTTNDMQRFLDLDTEYQATRNALLARWGGHDLRVSTFFRCASVLRSAYVGHAQLVMNLATGQFWDAMSDPAGVDDDLIGCTCREFESFLVIGTDQLFFSAVEDSFRQLVTALDPTACGGPAAEFKNVYGWLLNHVGLRQWEPLLDLLRMTRNVVHNNGRYVDRRGSDRTISHGGKAYAFENGKHIDFVHWHFFADRFAEVHVMLKDVYSAPAVEQLGPVRCHSANTPQ